MRAGCLTTRRPRTGAHNRTIQPADRSQTPQYRPSVRASCVRRRAPRPNTISVSSAPGHSRRTPDRVTSERSSMRKRLRSELSDSTCSCASSRTGSGPSAKARDRAIPHHEVWSHMDPAAADRGRLAMVSLVRETSLDKGPALEGSLTREFGGPRTPPGYGRCGVKWPLTCGASEIVESRYAFRYAMAPSHVWCMVDQVGGDFGPDCDVSARRSLVRPGAGVMLGLAASLALRGTDTYPGRSS